MECLGCKKSAVDNNAAIILPCPPSKLSASKRTGEAHCPKFARQKVTVPSPPAYYAGVIIMHGGVHASCIPISVPILLRIEEEYQKRTPQSTKRRDSSKGSRIASLHRAKRCPHYLLLFLKGGLKAEHDVPMARVCEGSSTRLAYKTKKI